MAPKPVDRLLYEPEDNGLRFNCPDRLNALAETTEENSTVAMVGKNMRSGGNDPSTRVIVLTNMGRSFRAGADSRLNKGDAGESFPGRRTVHKGLGGTQQHFLQPRFKEA
jgi:enoyl-CoA hydratase/carnithine racemase